MIAPTPSPNGTDSVPTTPRALRLRGALELAQGLAEGLGVVEASRRAGIHRRTASKRLQDPEFKAYVRSLRAESLEQASAKLSTATSQAVDVLIELMSGENEFCRLQAARAVLESALRMREVLDVEERLAAIEARLAAQERNEESTATRRW